MVVACHLGGRLGMERGRRGLGGFLAQSRMRKHNPESPDKRTCNTARHTTSKERDVETTGTLALILLTKQQLPCTNNKHIAQI